MGVLKIAPFTVVLVVGPQEEHEYYQVLLTIMHMVKPWLYHCYGFSIHAFICYTPFHKTLEREANLWFPCLRVPAYLLRVLGAYALGSVLTEYCI